MIRAASRTVPLITVVVLAIGCDEPKAPTSPSTQPSSPAPAGFVLAGTITATPLNEPVSGARVEALHDGQVVQSAVSDTSGGYRIIGLPAQEYSVRTIRTGYNAPTREVSINADTRLDLLMDRNRVTLFGIATESLRCATTTIENARVEILDGPDAGKAGLTDRSGLQYRIDGVAWGTFRVRATKAGYATADAMVSVAAPEPVAGFTVRQDFELPAQVGLWTMRGEVTNRLIEAGQINGALVEITGGPNAGRSMLTGSGGVGNGIFQFRDLHAGSLDLRVSAPGFVTETLKDIPLCGDRSLLFNVRMTPTTAALRGLVTDETGTPLAGATVEIISGPPAGKSAVTGTTGQYEISGIYGTFSVLVTKGGYIGVQASMTTGQFLAGNFVLRRMG